MKTNPAAKMTKLAHLTVGIAACGAAVITAYAAATFNPATGLGFVGKGEIQTPWGWNDATLQANAANVRFYYAATESMTYSAVCEWFTGPERNRKQHDVTHTIDKVTAVESTVNHEARRNNQGRVTGFNLLGMTQTAVAYGSDKPAPVVGGPCPGNQGHDGVWVSVDVTATSSSVGGLYAVHQSSGNGPLLLWSPVVE